MNGYRLLANERQDSSALEGLGIAYHLDFVIPENEGFVMLSKLTSQRPRFLG